MGNHHTSEEGEKQERRPRTAWLTHIKDKVESIVNAGSSEVGGKSSVESHRPREEMFSRKRNLLLRGQNEEAREGSEFTSDVGV
jgi:hypothetical protein